MMWWFKNGIVMATSFQVALLSILIFPFDFGHHLSNRLMKIWTHIVLFIYGVKVRVYGREHIDPSKGKIYISNHSSFLDIFVQLAKLPDNVRMIYKREMNRIPILGLAMRCAGFIPIDRKRIKHALRSLAQAAQKVRRGLSVVIYPEGTRTKDGTLGEFKRGVLVLAEKSEADIVPVTITHTFDLMPPGAKKVKPGVVEMVIGEPIPYRNDEGLLNEVRNKVIENTKKISKAPGLPG